MNFLWSKLDTRKLIHHSPSHPIHSSPSHPGITNTWTDRLVFLSPPSAGTLGSCSRSKWAVCIQNHFAALMHALSYVTQAAAHCPFTPEWTGSCPLSIYTWVNCTHSQLSEQYSFTAEWTVLIHSWVKCAYLKLSDLYSITAKWTVLIHNQAICNRWLWMSTVQWSVIVQSTAEWTTFFPQKSEHY